MQAIIPAAGMGKRLGDNAENKPKCMIEISDLTLLERAAASLKGAGVTRLIVIVGFQSDLLQAFVNEKIVDIDTIIIDNPLYATTNNIYTLYLARQEMVKEDTILLESDLIFDHDLLSSLVQSQAEDMAVVDLYDPNWMDGTVVLLQNNEKISSFVPKSEIIPEKIVNYYKTVNIYKFSKGFSQKRFMPALTSAVENGDVNSYYETVLGEITKNYGPCLSAFKMNGRKWYEIDNEVDLAIAKSLFQ
ncbi:phosphocholine cytidylyltransferase family protein [Candidatus Brevifilum fermentans]|jgi:choline kinase|uniref:MobA-like NTP transferase domain-containing protein n=1 Tax=Candidatus Brevifilum fermentans TaxID=1986204 RepID=A0A1Y6K3I0_9CHLR|nr:phosphocholine cytidylyltransferase family protein [Brevefilum fermentans]MDI9567030.1 phosphocholine cytidylyltransferase family protein [Chloroflexota bacterium]SMX54231.1 conserved protein of unknown function [Brevefilum fermentans]